jgi:hypothetical protein
MAKVDESAFEILSRFDLDRVALTRGSEGTSLYVQHRMCEAQVPKNRFGPRAPTTLARAMPVVRGG